MKENISKHITYDEGVVSATGARKGIKNIPPPSILKNMKATAEALFEPLREKFGPVIVISFYRSPELNRMVGGSKTSAHMTGHAIDVMHTNGFTNADIFNFFKNGCIPYDQIIWEFGTSKEPQWVHIGYNSKGHNRRQALKATKVKGKTVYTTVK